ncbi:hypothetical protein D9M71_747110 [compost metagenome]
MRQADKRRSRRQRNELVFEKLDEIVAAAGYSEQLGVIEYVALFVCIYQVHRLTSPSRLRCCSEEAGVRRCLKNGWRSLARSMAR